jgi:predicted signal transduction protein with EAL and GGDEF domain
VLERNHQLVYFDSLIGLPNPRYLLGRLSATTARPERLVLEITESALLQDQDSIRSKLMQLQLQTLGIGLSLDDFGAGYSSLS